MDIIASNTLRYSDDTETSTTSATYVKLKTITLDSQLYGTIRIKFDLKLSGGPGTARGRIYHNDVALGTEQTTTSSTYVTKSEDITYNFEVGDTIELWGYIQLLTATYVENFRLYYDIITTFKPIVKGNQILITAKGIEQ